MRLLVYYVAKKLWKLVFIGFWLCSSLLEVGKEFGVAGFAYGKCGSFGDMSVSGSFMNYWKSVSSSGGISEVDWYKPAENI